MDSWTHGHIDFLFLVEFSNTCTFCSSLRCGLVTLGVFVVVCSSPVLRSILWGIQPASTPFPAVLSTSRRYYHVSIGVAPKRAALAAASEELQVAKTKLADAETQLADVMKKIHDLETSYNNAVTKKQELEEEMERCKIRLASAMKLIGGLGGEEARWQSSSEALTVSFNQLSGSVVRVDDGVGLRGLLWSSWWCGTSSVPSQLYDRLDARVLCWNYTE